MTSNRMPGLDFGLGETADMIRSSAESFAQAEIAPRAEEIEASSLLPLLPLPAHETMGITFTIIEKR